MRKYISIECTGWNEEYGREDDMDDDRTTKVRERERDFSPRGVEDKEDRNKKKRDFSGVQGLHK